MIFMLLQNVAKITALFVTAIIPYIGNVEINEVKHTVINVNESLNTSLTNEIIEYNTEYIYNAKKPSNYEKIIKVGANGVKSQDNDQPVILKEAETQIVEKGTGAYGIYTGKITGYGPDCPGCSKVGNVACRTKEKNNHSLINDGIFYTDEEYGKVHILAADNGLFPCGTIVEFSDSKNKYIGVILDTGGTMRKAWREKGQVWIDLAYSSQESARSGFIHGNKINFNVQRFGW